MISRIITSEVERALKRQAAVGLIGPRQVGKTTLALEIARSRDERARQAGHAEDDGPETGSVR